MDISRGQAWIFANSYSGVITVQLGFDLCSMKIISSMTERIVILSFEHSFKPLQNSSKIFQFAIEFYSL